MGDFQVGFVDGQIIVKQYVNINRSVGISARHTFLLASHVAFYLLCQQEQLSWCLYSFTKDDGIHELVFGLKAPWFRLDERRLAEYTPHLVANHTDSSLQVLSTIAQIRA